MTSSAAGRPGPTVLWRGLRLPAVEPAAQLVLIGLALLVVGEPDQAGAAGRITAVLVLTAAVGAALLLVTGGWVSDNRRAVRLAGAVGVLAAAVLLPAAAGAGPATGMWALTVHVGLLGVVGFLVLAVRASADRRGDRITAYAVATVLTAATAALAGIALLAPYLVPPPLLVRSTDLVVWSGTGAAALVLLVAGTVADRTLLRGTALAFCTLAAGHAARIAAGPEAAAPVLTALQLAAVAMLLGVAVRFVRTEVGVLVVRRARLARAEAAVAAARERELRTRAGEPAGSTTIGELGAVLDDLALAHRADGLDVRVRVDGDPRIPVDAAALTPVLSHLLVHCAEQAPGAGVRLRAAPHDGRLRVEVVDDGPELPADAAAALVQRGGRPPRPVGAVLDLPVLVAVDRGPTATDDPTGSGPDDREPVAPGLADGGPGGPGPGPRGSAARRPGDPEPDATDLGAADPGATEPDGAEPDVSGLDGAELDVTGLDGAGLDVTGPGDLAPRPSAGERSDG